MTNHRDDVSQPCEVTLSYSGGRFRIHIRDTHARFGMGADAWVMSASSRVAFRQSLIQRVSEWEHLVGGSAFVDGLNRRVGLFTWSAGVEYDFCQFYFGPESGESN